MTTGHGSSLYAELPLPLLGKSVLLAGPSRPNEVETIAAALAGAGAEIGTPESVDGIADWTKTLRDQRSTSAGSIIAGNTLSNDSVSDIDAVRRVDTFIWLADAFTFNQPYLHLEVRNLAERAELDMLEFAAACNRAVNKMTREDGGSIILVTVPPNTRPWLDITAAAVKQALVETAKNIAQQHARLIVRVNVVSAVMNPDRLGLINESVDPDSVALPRPTSGHSATRALAQTLVWLASDAAKDISGSHLQLGPEPYLAPTHNWSHELAVSVAAVSHDPVSKPRCLSDCDHRRELAPGSTSEN